MSFPYPISANRYWRIFRNRVVRSKEAEAYKQTVAIAARYAGAAALDCEVGVSLCLRPRKTRGGAASRVRLDLDNAIKVTLDALNGIAWLDDSQVVRLDAWIGEPVEGGGVDVKVERVARWES
jgi:crossover junction endodeoxyribonuclease RusA